jgi:outer membrane protein assembly factor BamB
MSGGETHLGVHVRPARSDARPWTFATAKGVFSSPVIDGEGTAYIGSADHAFYAIRADGSLKWKFLTGEIIDSSALLDDRARLRALGRRTPLRHRPRERPRAVAVPRAHA